MKHGTTAKVLLGIVAPALLSTGAGLIIWHPALDAYDMTGRWLIIAALLLCLGAWIMFWWSSRKEKKAAKKKKGRPFSMD